MYYYYEVALFGKPDFLLTYQSEKKITKGTKVTVPLANRVATGLIWECCQKPKFSGKVLSIKKVIDQDPLLCEINHAFYNFCSRYYHTPVPLILKAAFANKAQTGDLITELPETFNAQDSLEPRPMLNEEQNKFINKVKHGAFKTYLLDGITGSGKTFCYINLIEKALRTEQNILVLVPEISLVENIKNQFLSAGLNKIICYHSQISADQKARIFSASRKMKSHIFIATRSGIFLPINQIGLIIVDEEHDSSFKEENKSEQFFGFKNNFFYNARDLAIKKSQLFNCPCILGSATPSLQSLQRAQNKVFLYSQLTKRATEQKVPKVEIIPTVTPTWKNPIDPKILLEIKATVDNKKQALIYLNQRGYIPNLFCKNCHISLTCPHCSSKVVLHEDQKEAHCHYCCKKVSYQPQCSKCNEPWIFCGFGTQRLKEYLEQVFPFENITLIDTDHITTTKKLNDTLKKVSNEQSGIIIGTQMVCKGHNWPNVALSIIMVGHYQLEHSLDEKVAQNIIQVAGRSGRFTHGRAIMPYPMDKKVDDNLKPLLENNYSQWIKAYHLSLGDIAGKKYAKINIRTKNLEDTLQQLSRLLCELDQEALEGPILDYPAHVGEYWRVYILINTNSYQKRDNLISLLSDNLKSHKHLIKNLSIDIDPLSIDSL